MPVDSATIGAVLLAGIGNAGLLIYKLGAIERTLTDHHERLGALDARTTKTADDHAALAVVVAGLKGRMEAR